MDTYLLYRRTEFINEWNNNYAIINKTARYGITFSENRWNEAYSFNGYRFEVIAECDITYTTSPAELFDIVQSLYPELFI